MEIDFPFQEAMFNSVLWATLTKVVIQTMISKFIWTNRFPYHMQTLTWMRRWQSHTMAMIWNKTWFNHLISHLDKQAMDFTQIQTTPHGNNEFYKITRKFQVTNISTYFFYFQDICYGIWLCSTRARINDYCNTCMHRYGHSIVAIDRWWYIYGR